MSATCLLEARNLRVDYGAMTALRNFNLRLDAGHVLGLVGPNGAGKTTAMRALAGLLPLTTGEIRVLGEKIDVEAGTSRSQIGFAPDSPLLYDGLTVREYLEFVGRSYGLRHEFVATQIDYWLEQLWLTEKRAAQIGTLSRGMRQRLNVARTLLPNPALILLDEPAAGLDPAGRVEFRRVLVSLREQGRTLIVSSHILSDLPEFCTHIAIMEAGCVRQFDTVAAIAGGMENGRCRYRLMLAAPRAELAALLRRRVEVTNIAGSGTAFDFEYLREPAAAAALLRELIVEGVAVASFTPQEAGLEEAYLRAGIRQVD